MKAIFQTSYGDSTVLKVGDLDIPSPSETEVLVRVRATSFNDYDWSKIKGKPTLYRLLFGLTKPKDLVPGMELSGIVESVGADVKRFKPGDSVYGDISGDGFGSFAEYVSVSEKALSKKPDSMTYEEAAALSHAGALAKQALIDLGGIAPRQKILINGAGGGVGTIGLAIAKKFEAEITGVDTGSKLERMSSIGFDQVLDYKLIDFTKLESKYNLILDAKSSHSPADIAKVLSPNGKYITVGGKLHRLFQIAVFGKLYSKIYGKEFSVLNLKTNVGLDYLESMYINNELDLVIDGPHSLEDIPSLLNYFGEGQHIGKIVISI